MVIIPKRVMRQIQNHAASGYPEEVCGLLLGQWREADRREVSEAAGIDNVRADRAGDRFELDPRQHLRVQRRARQQGQAIVGVYHSHPDAAATPSATDQARAVEIWHDTPSWSYVIVSVEAGEAAQIASWVLRGGSFEQETIEQW